MGYTHYWENLPEFTPEIIEDAENIILSSLASIKGPDGTGMHEATTERISLNGDASRDEDYETFVLSSGGGWNFCKTARRPYDEVVTALLILMGEHGAKISSDGNWDAREGDHGYNWEAGRNLYAVALDREPVNPL